MQVPDDRVADLSEVGTRIRARLSAEEIASLADGEAERYGKHVWKCLHDICCAHVPCNKGRKEDKGVVPMSDQEAKWFGKQPIMFGKHAGETVDSVNMEYLEWLADQIFIDDLRRYLKSQRIMPERRTDDV